MMEVSVPRQRLAETDYRRGRRIAQEREAHERRAKSRVALFDAEASRQAAAAQVLVDAGVPEDVARRRFGCLAALDASLFDVCCRLGGTPARV